MLRNHSTRGQLVVCLAAALICFSWGSVSAQTALPPIVVEGQTQDTEGGNEAASATVQQTTAGPVDGYRALTAASATKTDTPIEQIPQSIQVVPRSVIEDQGNLTVTEATHNVSNVQATNDLVLGNTDLQSVKIRGFGAEQWLDGMTVIYDTGWRDAFANVERIEVLKGPNAILYGGGPGAPIGGAVNVVSKLPTEEAGGEVGFIFGSHSYLRPWFDVNTPLTADGTVLFRFTGEYATANSFVDVVESENYSINPTLTLTNKTDTTLTVQGRASRSEQQAYQGLPVTGTIVGDFRIDPDTFLGPSDIIPSYSEVHGVTVTLDHKLDSIWSANVKARWSDSAFDQHSQSVINADFTGATPFIDPSTWALGNIRLFQEQEEISINPSLQAKFEYGPSRNVLLFGVDYSRVTDQGFMNSELFIGLVDLTNPVFPIPYTPPPAGAFFDFDSVYTTKGAYTQLQSTIYNRVHLLGGVRLANIEIDYLEKALLDGPKDFQTDETKLLPRAGVLVDLFPGLAVYGSYSEGMRASPFSQVTSPKPEESTQREAGLKFNIANQLSGTVAVFEIERSNIAVPIGLGNAILSEQVARGFETDLIWQPNENWRVLANYAYTNAEFADNLQGVPEGNRVPGVPEHSGRLWINYAFDPAVARDWSVGAGIYLASSQYVDAANLYKTDGYFTVDAKIAYDPGPYSAALHVKNLTDEDYFVPYTWLGGQVAPGEGRVVYGTLTYKF
jgi:iron complex outermembrane receptor protein